MQTARDNMYGAGNIIGFRKGLAEMYGKDYLEYVESDLKRLYPFLGLSIPEIKEKTVEARKIAKKLKQLDKTYTAKQRLKLRTDINAQLDIYPQS